MKKYIAAALLALLILPVSLFSLQDEYLRKAALLKVFGQYIHWPGETGNNDQSKPFVIGIIGKNPFGPLLEKVYSKSENKIKNKNVQIILIKDLDPQQILSCHILFIAKSASEELEQIISYTRGKPILTVGETKGFSEQGVLFNLYVSQDEIRFEVNGAALQESRLIADSQLLSVATIVKMPGHEK